MGLPFFVDVFTFKESLVLGNSLKNYKQNIITLYK